MTANDIWRPAGSEVTGPRADALVEPTGSVLERAKGALMLHTGIGSHEAMAILVGWAKATGRPVHTVAEVLVRGVWRGEREVLVAEADLTGWLQAQLKSQLRDLGGHGG